MSIDTESLQISANVVGIRLRTRVKMVIQFVGMLAISAGALDFLGRGLVSAGVPIPSSALELAGGVVAATGVAAPIFTAIAIALTWVVTR